MIFRKGVRILALTNVHNMPLPASVFEIKCRRVSLLGRKKIVGIPESPFSAALRVAPTPPTRSRQKAHGPPYLIQCATQKEGERERGIGKKKQE